MAQVVVTGASGFVGRHAVRALASRGHLVRAVTRGREQVPNAHETMGVGDLLEADLATVVGDAQIVINCAAYVHRIPADPSMTRRMNYDFALELAHVAKAARAARFVQLSSVAAITSHTDAEEIVDDDTIPRPDNDYGAVKLAADVALMDLNTASFSVISLRPPVVIGAGAAAWFGLLDRAARLGLPMPVAAFDNRRSFLFVDNLADAVAAAAEGDDTGAFVVTDSEPVSTARLYRKLLAQHGHGDRVWRWPPPLIRALAKTILRSRASSLLGDAAYDGSRFRSRFNWTPPVTVDDGLRRLATSRHSVRRAK